MPNSPLKLVIRIPLKAIKVATDICITNLYRAGMLLKSSIIPIANNTAIEKKKEITKTSFVKWNQSRQAMIIPVQDAIPPMVGIGVLCSFRMSGTSKSLKRLMILIRGGITNMATIKAVIKASTANLKEVKLRSIWIKMLCMLAIGSRKIAITAYLSNHLKKVLAV